LTLATDREARGRLRIQRATLDDRDDSPYEGGKRATVWCSTDAR